MNKILCLLFFGLSMLNTGCATASGNKQAERSPCTPGTIVLVQFALQGGEGLGEKTISEFEADPNFKHTNSKFILDAFREACSAKPSRAIKLDFALGRIYDPKSKISIWLLSSNEIVMRGHLIPLNKKTSDDLFDSVEELFPDSSKEEF